MDFNINEAEILIDKLMDFFAVSSAAELSEKINTSQKTISNWKTRNSVSAIKKKCRELGIYQEIFGDISSSNNEIKKESENNLGISNYFVALESVAVAIGKEDELIEDIKELMKKYISFMLC